MGRIIPATQEAHLELAKRENWFVLKFCQVRSIPEMPHLGCTMLVDRQFIQPLPQQDHLSTLSTLEIGQSVFCDEWRQAASLRSLSYYLIKTRKPGWNFTFRKMDRGWRLIRIA